MQNRKLLLALIAIGAFVFCGMFMYFQTSDVPSVPQTITTATGSNVIIPFNGKGCVVVHVAGTWTGSIAVQGSVDGVNFQPRDTLQQLLGKWPESIGSNGDWYIGGFASFQVKLAGPVSTGSATITYITMPSACNVYTFAIPGAQAGNAFFGGTVSATSTQTTVADNVQGHDLADVGVHWSGITGSPQGCLLQAQYFFGQSGPAINTGPPQPLTPGIDQAIPFVGPFGLAVQFVYSCVTYPAAGTLSIQITYKPGGKTLINGVQTEVNASWTSATANNTSLQQNVFGYSNTTVAISQGSTITGGQVNFEVSDSTAFTNAYPVQCQRDDGAFASTYVLVASTNRGWTCSVSGWQAFRVRLSPAITGTATVTVGITSTTGGADSTVAISNNPSVFVAGVVTASNTANIQDQGASANYPAGSSLSVPMAVLPFGWNGTNQQVIPFCSNTTFISALGAATSQIVALVSGKKIRVCSINFGNTNATATNIKFVEGTGANCAVGQAQLTGNYVVAASANLSPSMTASGPLVTLTAGDALCATGSAAGAVDVTITFAQY